MKTKWMIIPVIALALGCSREIDTNITYINGEFSLYAYSGENDTRTVLQQDGSILWSPEDCIKVFYGNLSGKFTSTNSESAASTEFTGSLGSFVLDGETEFIAVYPYSDDTILGSNGDNLSIVLPSEQAAVEGTFADDLFICVANSYDVNLSFYNVCGGVKFSLERDDIKRIVFKGNNGEILAGRMAVEFNSEGLPKVTDFTAGQISVTLTAPDGGTFKSRSWYYLVLAPQVLTKGYTMELWTDELVDTISSCSSVSIRRSVWGVLKNLSSAPEMIDLGLSVKWGTRNLGALNPEDFGDYFAWGETETKDNFDLDTYKWYDNSRSLFSKYNKTDKRMILDLEDDAAHVQLGDKWRIPTKEELAELSENCDLEWPDDYNNCCVVKSRINGNRIILPAAGGKSSPHGGFNDGFLEYWTSSRFEEYPQYAYVLDRGDLEYYYRDLGHTIRPVYGDFASPVESISLANTAIDVVTEGIYTLVATVLPEDATNKNIIWSSSDESVAIVSYAGIVTGVAPGSAIISATTSDGGKTATCAVSVTERTPVFLEAVDLGLSVKWANMNLGANMPEGYGNNYFWGETTPRSIQDNTPYKWSENYKYTKYNNADTKTQLDSEDDAAHVMLGDWWRMPTATEMEELLENCIWTPSLENGFPGYTIQSKINGNKIFLPKTSYWNSPEDIGGWYWSSTRNSNLEYYSAILFYNPGSDPYVNYQWSRGSGCSIRPVYGVPVESITLNLSNLELSLGCSQILDVTFSPDSATNQKIVWSSSDDTIAIVSSYGVIRGVSIGSTTITATSVDGGKKAICNVTVTKASSIVATPEIVDLGLSVKWASFNLGATRPDEFGDYFAWGETEPYYLPGYALSTDPLWKEGKEAGYEWASYRWSMGTDYSLTKYCYYGNGYNGFYDGISILEPEDDAAHIKLGDFWRIPTNAEWTELVDSCTWEWSSLYGENGFRVIGPNGNSIFLPAAGYRSERSLNSRGDRGYYWASCLSSRSEGASALHFLSDYLINDLSGSSRYCGLSIRPVYVE